MPHPCGGNRGEHLDRGGGAALANGPDGAEEMHRPAIGEVVAVHRRDHHVMQAELGHRIGDLGRLVPVEGIGQAGAHVAEGAGPRAGVAHDHEGGVLLLPALADIGAARFLADRDEAVLLHDGAGGVPAGRSGCLHPDPVGLTLDRVVGAMRLFRVPGALVVSQEVEDDGHGIPGKLRRQRAGAQAGT